MTADAGGGDAGNGPGDGRTQYDCCEPTGSTECTDDGKFRECRPTTRARCPTGGRWSQPKSCPGDDEICAESASSSQGCTEKTPCNTDNNNCSPRASCQVDSTADDGYRCVCDKKGDGRFCYSDELYTRIDAGTFEMGSPSGETGRESDETQHTVQIDHSFLMRTQEARQPDWEGSNQPWTKTSVSCSSSNIPCPIFNVSWYDALFHANQLSKRHGFETCYDLSNCSGTPGEDYTCSSVSFEGVDCRGYRLPTEAEWEYAMRAGTTTATYKGELDPDANYSKLKDIAWFQANSGGQPHPFESREANDRGLYNGLGNVAEWVWDRYGSHPSRPVTDPTGPSNGMARVVRGGHWDSPAAACRAAARAKETPDTRNGKIGFRLVRTLIK
jgi:formylglycine-generating enzyme required for sulfatase activity